MQVLNIVYYYIYIQYLFNQKCAGHRLISKSLNNEKKLKNNYVYVNISIKYLYIYNKLTAYILNYKTIQHFCEKVYVKKIERIHERAL